METKLKKVISFIKSNWLIISIIIFSIFIRLIFVGTQSVWFDESISIHASMQPISYSLTFNDPTPPLYYFTLNIWESIFGSATFMFYLFSTLLSVTTVFMIYLIGSLFSSKAGVISSVIASISPIFTFYALEIRAYSLLFFTTALTLYFFLRLKKKFSNKNFILFLISSFLLIYSHLFGIFILFAFFIELIRSKLFINGFWKKWILGFSILFITYIPFLLRLYKLVSSPSNIWIPKTSFAMIYYFFQELVSGKILMSLWQIPLIIFMFFSVIALRSKKFKSISYSLLTLFLVSFFVPFFLSFFIGPFFMPKYVLFTLVFLIPLLAFGFLSFQRKTVSKIMLYAFLVFSLFVVIVQGTTVLKDNWKETETFLSSQLNDQIVVMPYYNSFMISYYKYPQCLEYELYGEVYTCLGNQNVVSFKDEGAFKFLENNFYLIANKNLYGNSYSLFKIIESRSDLKLIYTSKLQVSKLFQKDFYTYLNQNSKYDVYDEIRIYKVTNFE